MIRSVRPALYEFAKRLFDVVVAAVGLILLLPVLLVLAAAVLVSMGRPVLFTQRRPGLGGRAFTLYKFRSMREADPSRAGAESDDDRVTELGLWLRSTSLDELPTLWNVLVGDMSLVGPRPLLEEYVPHYSPAQARRHDVRPGITGLAQVSGRNNLSWETKIALDLAYIEKRSFLLDLRILLRTVHPLISREGAAVGGRGPRNSEGGTATDV